MGCGPGSYTSVRISVSAARAIAQSAGCRILPLSSLEVLAVSFYLLNSCVSGKVIAVRDAKMNQVYYQSFLFGNNSVEKSEIAILSTEKFKEILDKEGNVPVVTDTQSLADAIGNIRKVHLQKPAALGLIEVSENAYKPQELRDWSQVFPVYLRLSYAEIKKREDGS